MRKLDPMTRLMLVITGMEFTSSELSYLERALSRLAPGELQEACAEVVRHDYRFGSRPKVRALQHSSNTSVGDRVERLLKNEARLPTKIAWSLISTALIDEGLIQKADLPPLSKKSLSDWTDRLTSKVESREILRIATLIRNKFAHQNRPDWSSSST